MDSNREFSYSSCLTFPVESLALLPAAYVQPLVKSIALQILDPSDYCLLIRRYNHLLSLMCNTIWFGTM